MFKRQKRIQLVSKKITENEIFIRYTLKMSQHSVANEKDIVLSLWREESIYRLCELTLA